MGGRHRKPVGALNRILTGALVAGTVVLTVQASSPIHADLAQETVGAGHPPVVVTTEKPPPQPRPVVVEYTPKPTVAPPTTTAPPTTAEPTPEPEPVLLDPIIALNDYPSTGFGGVKPHVARAGNQLAEMFGVTTVIGVASRANVSDHPRGLALDLMVGNDTGNALADYALAHFDELGISYVIWKQRINYGSGWEGMEDRGGITANHFDHVHISFNP